MKITITGSLGNISKPLAEKLIGAGHTVTIISSNPGKTFEIERIGAKAAIGSVENVAFLTDAFKGSDIVYTMVPPNFAADNVRMYMATVGQNYAKAIQQAGVTKVVSLSSIGAHLDSGTGPIAGLHDVEVILSAVTGVSIKFLRAAFFYTNFLNDIPLLKYQGIIGANYPSNARLVMVHPEDIASGIASAMEEPFEGNAVSYVVSDESTMEKIAGVLGKAIGKDDLQWTEFTDKEAYKGMLEGGVPAEMARNFTEMGTAIRRGILWEDFDAHRPAKKGQWSLEDFAKEFARKFNQYALGEFVHA